MRLFSTIDPGCIWITLTEYSASVYWIYTEQPSAAHCCLLRAFSRVKELIAVVKDSPRFPLFTQDVVVPHTSSVPPFRANSHGLGLQQRSRASNIGHRLKSLYSPPTPPHLHSFPLMSTPGETCSGPYHEQAKRSVADSSTSLRGHSCACPNGFMECESAGKTAQGN